MQLIRVRGKVWTEISLPLAWHLSSPVILMTTSQQVLQFIPRTRQAWDQWRGEDPVCNTTKGGGWGESKGRLYSSLSGSWEKILQYLGETASLRVSLDLQESSDFFPHCCGQREERAKPGGRRQPHTSSSLRGIAEADLDFMHGEELWDARPFHVSRADWGNPRVWLPLPLMIENNRLFLVPWRCTLWPPGGNQ